MSRVAGRLEISALRQPRTWSALSGFSWASDGIILGMDQIKNPTVASMEGDGYYNRNSAMQAAGIARILPIWEKVAGTVPVGDETLVIADSGSSQ